MSEKDFTDSWHRALHKKKTSNNKQLRSITRHQSTQTIARAFDRIGIKTKQAEN